MRTSHLQPNLRRGQAPQPEVGRLLQHRSGAVQQELARKQRAHVASQRARVEDWHGRRRAGWRLVQLTPWLLQIRGRHIHALTCPVPPLTCLALAVDLKVPILEGIAD